MSRPGMEGKGHCGRVCGDAAREGFDFVEAYPNKEFVSEEAGPKPVIRKRLKPAP